MGKEVIALLEHAIKDGANFRFASDGGIMYVEPPETLFGYLYFSHMIPPFKPYKMCILGYGNGTIAELTRKIFGLDIKVTGVDIEKNDCSFTEYKMVIQDAKDFVWDCTSSIIKKRYDYIAIDLYNGKEVPEFVFETEFVVRLKEMATRLVCVNTPTKDFKRMKPYYDYGFTFERHDIVEGNTVSFWSV